MALIFFCALLNDNTVQCNGTNIQEQCDVPDSIQGKVVSIECGDDHSIAQLNDGTIRCWGYNHVGQCDSPEGLKAMRKN